MFLNDAKVIVGGLKKLKIEGLAKLSCGKRRCQRQNVHENAHYATISGVTRSEEAANILYHQTAQYVHQ